MSELDGKKSQCLITNMFGIPANLITIHLHTVCGHLSGLPPHTDWPFKPVLWVKGKAVPLQAWSGPQGSRKLRFPDFMTMAQDGGKVVSLMHWPPLPLGNTTGTHFC